MNINKDLEPLIAGISAAIVISILAFLTSETQIGIWLMFSFGATVCITFILYNLETAQPKNIFFGHLVTATVGVIALTFIPLPEYILIPIAVGLGVFFMIMLNVTHPPAGGNPIIVIIGSASFDYLLSPVITGSVIIIIFGVVLNKFILKKNYPN